MIKSAIPVIFICEEENAKALSVTLVSMLKNADRRTKYDISILSEFSYKEETINLILKLKDKYKCNIQFKNTPKCEINNCEDIALFLSNNLEDEKCIYLSYNVVVQKDLTELYNVRLAGNNLGGVKQAENGELCSNVLVINCENIRKTKTIKSISIELKYNFRADYIQHEMSFYFGDNVNLKNELMSNFPTNEIITALKKNVIFSFQNSTNPLVQENSSLYYEWWKYFRMSPFSKVEKETCNNPKVSIVMPIYNVEKYVSECLDSVINQTLEDIEIILVNDGSTDNSLKIIKEYAEFDKRIKIVEQENQGAGAARNKGLELSKGEYLLFLDSDDFFELTMLEKIYDKCAEKDLDIIAFHFMIYDQNLNKFTEIKLKDKPDLDVFSCEDVKGGIFNYFFHNAWTKLYKAEFIKNSDIKFQCIFGADDIYFANITSIMANKITIIENSLVYYRIGISSQTTSAKEPLSFTEAWKKLKNKIQDLGQYELLESGFLNSMLQSTLYHLKIMENTDGHELVYDYIKNDLEKEFSLEKYTAEVYGEKEYNLYNYIKNTPYENY